jgi:hypothetical protein
MKIKFKKSEVERYKKAKEVIKLGAEKTEEKVIYNE